MTDADLAAKAGVSRQVIFRIERGYLGVGMGAYVAVPWAMGQNGDVERLDGLRRGPGPTTAGRNYEMVAGVTTEGEKGSPFIDHCPLSNGPG